MQAANLSCNSQMDLGGELAWGLSRLLGVGRVGFGAKSGFLQLLRVLVFRCAPDTR